MARTAMMQAERITDVVRRLSDYGGGPTVEPIPGVSMLDLSRAPDDVKLPHAAELLRVSSLALVR
jgi:hypothetical protein